MVALVALVAVLAVGGTVLIPGSPTREFARGVKSVECVTWFGDEGRPLAVYGDSISHADSAPEFGLHGGRSWYSWLVCSDEFSDAGNHAVPGETSAQMLARLREDDPGAEVIVVQAGTNDLAAGVPTAETVANLRAAVEEARTKADVVLLTTVQPWHGTDADELNEAVRELAEHTGARLVDFAGALTDQQLTRDGVHPTREGARRLAVLIAEAAG